MPYMNPANYELPYSSASDTSEAAARAAARFVGQQGQAVLVWVASRGAHGATQREASEALGLGRPSVAARFHALEQCGSLAKTGGKRLGCAVYADASLL